MAGSKFQGSVAGSGTPKHIRGGKYSPQMQNLVELLNVGPMQEDVVSDVYEQMNELYPEVVKESVIPNVKRTAQLDKATGEVFTPDYGPTHTYGPYTGSTDLPAETAKSIGQDQVNFPPEFYSNVRPNDSENWNKPLDDKAEEFVHLEEFARLKEVSTLDIESNPALRDEFQRYLGKMVGSVAPNLYSRYSTEGEHAGDRQPTYYKKAGYIAEYNRKTYPDTTNAPRIQNKAIGLKEQVIKNFENYHGMTKAAAELAWEEHISMDPNESILLKEVKANPTLFSTSFDEHSTIVDELSQMTAKVHGNFLKTLGRLSPQGMDIFVDKIIKNNPEYTRTRAQEAIYSFMLSYSAVAESARQKGVDLGVAWSDILFLSTLSHFRNRLQEFEEKRRNSDDPNIRNITTGQAIEEKNEDLMVSVSDDGRIGRIIAEYMGFPKATSEQKAILGAIAKALVIDTFQHQEDSEVNIEDKNLYSKKKLFEKTTKTIRDDSGQQKTHRHLFSLTAAGIDLANKAMPLLNKIMPQNQIKPRGKPSRTTESILKKLGKDTRIRDEEGNLGDKVSLGDVTKMDMMKNQAENTPVRINPKMYSIINLIKDDFENKMLSYKNDLSTPEALAVYETTLMYELDGPEFQNMKGDGLGNKGVFGGRLGYVYKKDRQGAYIYDAKGEPETWMDASDKIKDNDFLNDLNFLEENLGREFFYDYFWGLNTRLFVRQTIGNYQNSKSSRSMIESAKPFAYKLDDALHVIALKAGIMKRFKYDKMDPISAADMFDAAIADWSTINPNDVEGAKKILSIAGKAEGWASIPSILEAIAFNAELQNPNSSGTYTTGFFTEIDGLTNGMAWSATQAGDMNTAIRAQVFDAKHYTHWVNNYAEIERLQREGKIDELAKLNVELKLPDVNFTVYMDAYNKVNHELKENIRRLWGEGKGEPVDIDVGVPGLLTTISDEYLTTLMGQAHENGGSKRFLAALNILKHRDHPLSRKFVKKPVMIFGYGARAARILDSVRLFVEDLLMQDTGGTVIDKNGNKVTTPPLAEVFRESGINIDKHLINPLGILTAEAVNQSFGEIKILGNILSRTATEAYKQGFPLRIPTQAGHFINLGGVVYEVDDSPGSKVEFKYYPGDQETAFKLERGEVNKDGSPKKTTAISRIMKKLFLPWAMKEKYLKAATQITVFLNHANDNININQHLVNRHIELLKNTKNSATNEGYTWDEWLNNLESTTARVTGNTALHIFDGLLTMPIEAEANADGLNKVFYNMMKYNKGHASLVELSLTFDLGPDGSKVLDDYSDIGGTKETAKNVGEWGKGYTSFKRLLNKEGKALAIENEWGTWHPRLDKFAFNWGDYGANEEAAVLRTDIRTIERNRKELTKNITNIKQFLWSPDSVLNLFNKNKKELTKRHAKKKKVISS